MMEDRQRGVLAESTGTTPVETMAEWIDRQPWPFYVKDQAHAIGDKTTMGRSHWQAWLDKNHNGLWLAARVIRSVSDKREGKE